MPTAPLILQNLRLPVPGVVAPSAVSATATSSAASATVTIEAQSPATVTVGVQP